MKKQVHYDDILLKRHSIGENKAQEVLSENNKKLPEPLNSPFQKELGNQGDSQSEFPCTPIYKMPYFHQKKKTSSTLDGLSVSPSNFYSPVAQNLTDSFENDPTEFVSKKSDLIFQLNKENSETIFRTPKKNREIDDFENSNYYRNAPKKSNDNPLDFSPTAIQFSNLNDF